MSDSVPELTAARFEEFSKSGLVFIDFFAEWCMPCLMMSPIVDELSNKFRGKIKFGKVNVSDNESIAAKFNVSSIPHFVLLSDGKVVDEFTGAMSTEDLEERLNQFVE